MGTGKDTAGSPSTTTTGRTRQQPGLACDECRARKLRCDRQRPACSLCQSLGSECVRASTSLPRGPKKGHMRILQSKINDLERRLSETETVRSQPLVQTSEAQPEPTTLEATEDPLGTVTPSQCFVSDTGYPGLMPMDQLASSDFEINMDYFMMQTSPDISEQTFGFPTASTTKTCDSAVDLTSIPSQSASTFMTSVMQADLDQMYFDRVHVFIPMLHQKRYIVRSRLQTFDAQPFDCLRQAVWMMAASVCQPQNVQDMLYVQAKTSLEGLEMNSYEGSEHLEEAQAWVLMAIYEMKRVSFRKGWISAGRAIRLIHLMKLHEVDMPAGLNDKKPLMEAQQSESTLTLIEERRRTFWMGYFLDRMVNLLNQVPFTISEQSILTRLPAPEEDFQAGRPVVTAFIFEVLQGTEKRKLSSFNNLLILMTLWGRGLLCRHRRLVDRFYGNESSEPDFYHRIQWLDGIISQTERIMAAHGSYSGDKLDSMLLFTNMIGHTMLLALCKTGGHSRTDAISNMSTSNVIKGYEAGTSKSVTEMLILSDALSHYGQSNIHPFAAIPLYFCADFIQSSPEMQATQSLQLDSILYTLRELGTTNVVAKTCVQLLNSKCSVEIPCFSMEL